MTHWIQAQEAASLAVARTTVGPASRGPILATMESPAPANMDQTLDSMVPTLASMARTLASMDLTLVNMAPTLVTTAPRPALVNMAQTPGTTASPVPVSTAPTLANMAPTPATTASPAPVSMAGLAMTIAPNPVAVATTALAPRTTPRAIHMAPRLAPVTMDLEPRAAMGPDRMSLGRTPQARIPMGLEAVTMDQSLAALTDPPPVSTEAVTAPATRGATTRLDPDRIPTAPAWRRATTPVTPRRLTLRVSAAAAQPAVAATIVALAELIPMRTRWALAWNLTATIRWAILNGVSGRSLGRGSRSFKPPPCFSLRKTDDAQFVLI